ncbi:hypothetical protein JHK84_043528 [Glycine max]|nr:hypothetical protein JHK84_043528 [Glycine max]
MESARVVAARAMKGVRRADDVVEYEEVIGLSVIGALNEILTPEHQSEIRGYVFNHQEFIPRENDILITNAFVEHNYIPLQWRSESSENCNMITTVD